MKRLELKHASRKIEVARDKAGVPHVSAGNFEDALYGMGYVHSLDRRTQILFARAIGQGRAAELIADKPTMLESDRFFRRAGLYLRLDEEVAQLPDDQRSQLTAYTQGVNDGLRQAGSSLAMRAVRFRTTPWDVQAVLLIGNLLAYSGLAMGQQRAERVILDMILAGVASDRLRELYAPHLDHADFELLKQVKTPRNMSEQALAELDLPKLTGSNAWAVAPGRTRPSASQGDRPGQGAGPLLASDPHLEIDRLPTTWYEVVLRWGASDYLIGASLPGTPLIAVGRNAHLAWGTTYAMGDTLDFFIEDCRVQEGHCQYRRGDQWHDFQVRHEVLARKKKKPAPEILTVYTNPQGTLEADPLSAGPGYLLSSSWTGQRGGAGAAIGTWLRLAQSQGVMDGMHVVRDAPQPTLIWIFADRAGHIGRQVSGRYPVRPEHASGLVPLPAWDERNHWQGWVDPRELPSSFDPPEGFVASANQDPGGPRLVTLPAADYRFRRICERLEELKGATLADMQALQYDVVSLQARDLLTVFLPFLKGDEFRAFHDRLAAWDLRFNPESIEATYFGRLYRNTLFEIVGGDPKKDGGLGLRRVVYLSNQPNFSLLMFAGIDRILRQDTSTWWQGRDKGDVIRGAARRAMARPDRPWGEVNRITFENRFLPGFLAQALRLRMGPLALAGCHATPFQGHLRGGRKRRTAFGPSYHFVADLSRDEAWTNLPGGVSENRLSGLYKSDLKRWIKGEYKQLAP